MTAVIVQRVLGAARFDRESFLWMLWNDRAGGDAALLVIGTDIAIGLGLIGAPNFGLAGFVVGIIRGLIFWLLYSGIAWALGKFLLEGSGQYGGVLRIAGFAYPTRILIVAAAYFMSLEAAFLVGSVWFFAVVAHGLKEALELSLEKGAIAALGGFLGYLIVIAILPFSR